MFNLADVAEDKFDIVRFWFENKEFPNIRKVAMWMLSIPASQTTDERVFSATGFTLNSRRTNLGSSTLSDLTFISKNF